MQAKKTEYVIGQRVLAFWDDGTRGAWYPAEIKEIWSDGSYDVSWEDGTYTEGLRFAEIKLRRGRPPSASKPAQNADAVGAVVRLPMSEKQARFRRLAVPRVQKAVHAIKLVQNLSDRRHNQYSPEEASKVCSALRAAVDDLEKAFSWKTGAGSFEL